MREVRNRSQTLNFLDRNNVATRNSEATVLHNQSSINLSRRKFVICTEGKDSGVKAQEANLSKLNNLENVI
ncbi:hypothetical protein L596_021947 [Steinernema carpocapsae]|uniref:Uncharacterized protein n=1 Tax=Steinernema carpocapsae TaxID=34508 RepID=A0A4U5MKD0_STECR|nr:hypothetical protein L596_021947 [Steinernema carpocapsae]